MARDDAWMPLYVGDFMRDTGHLSAEEAGAYLLLLMQGWVRGGVLPADEKHLRTMARMDARAWARSRETILAFFYRTDDGWRQSRLDRELERSQGIVDQRRAAGRASAEARARQRSLDGRSTGVATDAITGAPTEAPTKPPRNARPSQSQPKSSLRSDLGGAENPPRAPAETAAPPPTAPLPPPPAAPAAGRGARLAPDWWPDAEERRFAADLGLDVDWVANQFRDCWHAKAGADGRKVDWSATWRGWCRRQVEFDAKRGGGAARAAPAPKPARFDARTWTGSIFDPPGTVAGGPVIDMTGEVVDGLG